MKTDATLSDDRTYRYRLTRSWQEDKPSLAFVMLNPSTADETTDDNTIRRCIGYAREWGYGEVVVGNLFAYRTDTPDDLWTVDDPVGPENDTYLRGIAERADLVVAAWGANAKHTKRDIEVMRLLDTPVYALNTTKHGYPNHPLYQRKDADIEPYYSP